MKIEDLKWLCEIFGDITFIELKEILEKLEKIINK